MPPGLLDASPRLVVPTPSPTPLQTTGPTDPSLNSGNSTPCALPRPAKRQGDTMGKSKHCSVLFPSSEGARHKSPLELRPGFFMG